MMCASQIAFGFFYFLKGLHALYPSIKCTIKKIQPGKKIVIVVMNAAPEINLSDVNSVQSSIVVYWLL